MFYAGKSNRNMEPQYRLGLFPHWLLKAASKKKQGLEYVPGHAFGLYIHPFFKEMPADFWIGALLCRVETRDLKTILCEQLQKQSLTASDFNKICFPQPPFNDLKHLS